MAKNPIAMKFKKFFTDLHAERQRLERELAHIGDVLDSAGGTLLAKARRGRKPKAVKAGKVAGKRGRPRGRRRRLGMTAEEFILKIVGEAGQMATAQINEQWKKIRAGVAGNTLTKLTKDKRLVKLENVEGRGSIYKLPGA